MSTSRHRIELMDLRRREPPGGYLLCRANGGRYMCGRSVEYEASFMYEQGGRTLERHLFFCPMHALAWAKRHGLLLPIMPSPDRVEGGMKYRIRHRDGTTEEGYTASTVLAEVKRSFAPGFARVPGAVFPVEDLESMDIISGSVDLFRSWPDDTSGESDAVIEKDD